MITLGVSNGRMTVELQHDPAKRVLKYWNDLRHAALKAKRAGLKLMRLTRAAQEEKRGRPPEWFKKIYEEYLKSEEGRRIYGDGKR